jgi:hypothetical protein
MAKIKGTGLESLRRLIKKRGASFEQKYLERLTVEEKKAYSALLSVSWTELPEYEEGNALVEAAKMLFPNETEGLRRLGTAMAVDFVPFMYKMFLRIPTIQFIFSKCAALWTRFYDTGTMKQENMAKKSSDLIVYDFPQMPLYLFSYLQGYYEGMGQLINAKNLRVTTHCENPNAWRWHLEWD